MAKHIRRHSWCIVTSLLIIATITMESRSHVMRINLLNDANNSKTVLDSDADYNNWIFRDPVPIELQKEPKPQRSRRSVHKEKIPPYFVNSRSPYSSIVSLDIGCVGTLISPMHVLTAAHCVHDGKKLRTGHLMRPLKIGLLRRNGRQHKIRVKKIYVPEEIRPNTASRFTYDYAVLKLVRRHKRPYLPVKASKGFIRSLKFHVFERDRGRKSRSLYRFTHCPVNNKRRKNYFQILAKYCPSSSGDSGTAVFDNSEEQRNSVIGILSATASYRDRNGQYTATVILRLTKSDVAKINRWISNS